MKLTAILLLAAGLTASAHGHSQKVSLRVKDAPIEEVFSSLKKQTGYNFVYANDVLTQARPVNLSISNSTLDEVLLLLFKSQPLSYAVVDKVVVVKVSLVSPKDNLGDEALVLPPIEITGKVTTKEGEPLAGASVVIKRTGRGTQTDANGNFKLTGVEAGDVLLISYTGFTQRTVKVGDNKIIFISLEVATNELDQVVIQAYGKTSQRLNTGNIAKVTAAEIEKQPVMNPMQALQGKVPGVVITQTSGFASAPFKVEIRGRSAINSSFTSDPLYIIDGVPLTILEIGGSSSYSSGSSGLIQNGMDNPANGQSPFFNLNPADIESIEILKDADATSIYGSRGANGVILITTKSGKAGKTKFDLNVNQGISKVTRFWDMLNTEQYLEMRREAFKNDGLIPNNSNGYDLRIWDTAKYTNWQKYLWGGTGNITNVQLGFAGGDNNTTFRIGAGYNRQTNILSISGADKRGSISVNLNHRSLNKKLSISLSSNYSYTESNMIRLPGGRGVLRAPNSPEVFDASGNLNYEGWRPASFPFANLLQPYVSKANFLNAGLGVSYQVVKALSFRTNLGYNLSQGHQNYLTTIASQNPANQPTGIAQFGNNGAMNWVVEPQFEYNCFIGKGQFSGLVGTTLQTNTTEGQSTIGYGYTSDFLLNTISNAVTKDAWENFGEYKYAAIFGRINYNLKNRYIINISGRRDGSSRFGGGKQFGNFGAIGIAWIFSDEKWINRHLSFLSFGKIRASYGTAGSDAVGDYKYLTRWSSIGGFPYNNISPLLPTQHVNPDYRWQVNKKLEAAIELAFLKDRLTLFVSWYRNRCGNQLVDFPLAIYTGFSSVVANSPALVQNSGWEFSLSGKLIESKNFKWTMSLNTGLNTNRLLAYPNLSQSPYASTLVIGQSLNIRKLLHYTGVDPQSGLYTFNDKNRDGTISNNTNDDKYDYDLSPKFNGGLGQAFSFKKFQVSLFFNIVKQRGLNSLLNVGTVPGTMNNQSLYVYNNRWQKPGDISTVARFSTRGFDRSYTNFNNSDGVYDDASFIRLSNLSFSYNLSTSKVTKIGLKALSIYLKAQNIFVLTKYKGIDPETQNFGGMPPQKVFTFGLSMNF